jgi:predicted nucleic acid-binding protein
MGGTKSMARVVVCDAGPLIHLDELGCLELLSDFARILLPASVWEEVLRHRPAALTAAGVVLEQKAAPTPLAEDLSSLRRILALHRGELDALHLARELQADLFLTDDAAARLAARQLSVPVHGTIGILLRAIRRGQKSRDEVSSILRSLPTASTLHIKQSLLDEILREIERVP